MATLDARLLALERVAPSCEARLITISLCDGLDTDVVGFDTLTFTLERQLGETVEGLTDRAKALLPRGVTSIGYFVYRGDES